MNGLMRYSNWLTSQPQRVGTWINNCAAMNSDAKWVVRNCQESNGYVCEWNPENGKEEEVVDQGYSCPNSSAWLDLGGDVCYIIETDLLVTWNEAMHHCFKHEGALASFHSLEEMRRIQTYLSKTYERNEVSSFHIGLGKRHDGSYAWLDRSPVDFTNFPDSTTESGDCFAIQMENLVWTSVNCYESRKGFVCSSPRSRTNQEIGAKNSMVEDVSKKLTIGGIIGIVICLLVVVAIGGVTTYYLYPSATVRVSLMEAEAL